MSGEVSGVSEGVISTGTKKTTTLRGQQPHRKTRDMDQSKHKLRSVLVGGWVLVVGVCVCVCVGGWCLFVWEGVHTVGRMVGALMGLQVEIEVGNLCGCGRLVRGIDVQSL